MVRALRSLQETQRLEGLSEAEHLIILLVVILLAILAIGCVLFRNLAPEAFNRNCGILCFWRSNNSTETQNESQSDKEEEK